MLIVLAAFPASAEVTSPDCYAMCINTCYVTQVPKAFKIIPNLLNWEEVLQLTDPEHWSPHAM
jgi:hypothetical protein